MKKSCFLSVLLTICIVLSGMSLPVAAADWSLWTRSGTTKINDDGTVTLTSTGTASSLNRNQNVAAEFEVETRIRIDSYSSEAGFQVNNGTHRLFINIRAADLRYMTGPSTSGNQQLTFAYTAGVDWHTYRVYVRGDNAVIFIDGIYYASIVIQTRTATANTYLWTLAAAGGRSEMTVDYFRLTNYKDSASAPAEAIPPQEIYNSCDNAGSWNTDASVSFNNGVATIASSKTNAVEGFSVPFGHSEDFDIEFRSRLSNNNGETGFQTMWEGNRIMLYFTNEGIRYFTSEGMQTQAIAGIKNEWHVWRIEVRGTVASMYMDGAIIDGYELQTWSTSSPTIRFWVKKSATEQGDNSMQVDYVRYTPLVWNVSLLSPLDKSAFIEGSSIRLLSRAPEGAQTLNYYANGSLIGTGEAPFYLFNWMDVRYGYYRVFAQTPDGESRSAEIEIDVRPATYAVLTGATEYQYGNNVSAQLYIYDRTSPIKKTEFFVDGEMAGYFDDAKDSFDFGILQVGRHALSARVYDDLGRIVTSNTHSVEVAASGSFDGVTLPTDYDLTFRVGGAGNGSITANDGFFRLELSFENGVLTRSESRKPLGAGDYLAQVRGGAVILYYNGKIAQSFNLPRNNGENGVYVNSGGILSEVRTGMAAGRERYVSLKPGVSSSSNTKPLIEFGLTGENDRVLMVNDSTTTSGITVSSAEECARKGTGNRLLRDRLSFTQRYTAEFALAVGDGSYTLSICDGAYLADLKFTGNEVSYLNAPFGSVGSVAIAAYTAVETIPYPFPREQTVFWRLEANRGIAQLFADNKFILSFRMAEEWGKTYIQGDAKECPPPSLIILKNTAEGYSFSDNFKDDGTNASASYWNAYGGNFTVTPDGYVSGGGNETALLYAFSKNTRFSARIKTDYAPEQGGIYIAARYNDDANHLRVGYDFGIGKWRVMEYSANTKRTVAEASGFFPTGNWVDLSLTLNEGSLALSVNGQTVLSTEALDYIGFGRVGFISEGAVLRVSGIKYFGEGAPTAGVEDFSLSGIHTPDMIRKQNGTFVLAGQGNITFESSDNGHTWVQAAAQPYYQANQMRLQSGKIITIRRELTDGTPSFTGAGDAIQYSYISDDDGLTFKNRTPIQGSAAPRLNMNGKISQAKDGRIFWITANVASGAEDFGSTRAYYSDNDGASWTASKEDVSIYNTDVNVQEPKIIELPDGTIRTYFRTDRGFLYYSDSPDRGATWDLNLKKTQFATVLTAFNIERDPYTDDYYMFWVYDNKNENRTKQYPRWRIALARSADCENWEYIMDVDVWNYGPALVDRFVNLGLDIYEDAVYLNSIRKVADTPGSSSGRLVERLYRVDKSAMTPLAQFSRIHTYGGDTAASPALKTLEKNSLIVKAGGSYALVRGTYIKLSRVPELIDGKLMLPSSVAAQYLGETPEANGNALVSAESLTAENSGRYMYEQDGVYIITTAPDWENGVSQSVKQYFENYMR